MNYFVQNLINGKRLLVH